VPVGPFDTCLVRFGTATRSTPVRSGGPSRSAPADRLEFGEFGRGKTIYDPLHYIPVLARKPGALRNGAPFKDWDLPPALRRVQRKLERQPGGDRQVVEILGAVLTDGLEAVEPPAPRLHSAGVVLNILARRREPPPPLSGLAGHMRTAESPRLSLLLNATSC
jgi:hypothetical protein